MTGRQFWTEWIRHYPSTRLAWERMGRRVWDDPPSDPQEYRLWLRVAEARYRTARNTGSVYVASAVVFAATAAVLGALAVVGDHGAWWIPLPMVAIAGISFSNGRALLRIAGEPRRHIDAPT